MNKLFFLSLIFILISFASFCQNIGEGLPFIQNYSPDDYQAHAQNWAIAQNDENTMFFGNTAGVLIYDGKFWSRLELPNESAVLSLHKHSNKKIYIGSMSDLGYIFENQTGEYIYASLKDKIPEEHRDFEMIWETISTIDGRILFRSSHKIFLFNPLLETMEIITPERNLYNSFKFSNSIYFWENGKGLIKLSNNKLKKVQSGEFFVQKPIESMLEIDNESALIFCRNNEVYTYYPQGKMIHDSLKFFLPFGNNLGNILEDSRVFCSLKINDSVFALGTTNKGIYFINKNGKLISSLNETKGLQNDAIRCLHKDSFNNLWVATNNGISYIILNSKIRFFNPAVGLEGLLSTATYKDGYYYAATTAGIFVKPPNSSFLRVKNAVGEAFMVKELEGEIYASDEFGLYKLEGIHAKKILDKYTWNLSLLKIEGDVKYYIAGSSDGLYVYQRSGDKWKYMHKVKGYSLYSRYVEVDNDGNIWVAHTHKGIFKVILNSKLNDCEVVEYSTEDGLPANSGNRLYKIKINNENRIVIATKDGIYVFDESVKKFTAQEDIKEALGQPYYIDRVAADYDGNIFLQTNERITALWKQDDGSLKADSSAFLKLEGYAFENIFAPTPEKTLFCSSKGLFVYHKSLEENNHKPFQVSLSEIQFGDSLTKRNFFYSSIEKTFPYEQNSVIFQFAPNYFEESEDVEFSYYLEGFDDEGEWSFWSKENKKEYTNLSEGSYIFHIKAKSIHNQESKISSYLFRILPPWYRTIWSYLLRFFLLLFLIVLAIRMLTNRMKRSKQKLEAIINERTTDLREANELLKEQQTELRQHQEEVLAQKELLIQQNEEISKQKDEIQEKNKQLEKLSIVASKTDNAVMIADKHGKIEWANEAFSAIYDLSIEDFKRNYGDNIFSATTNLKLKQGKEEFLKKKKSINYESYLLKPNGEKKWFQSTLTPILNNQKEITNLILIDTNINHIKEAQIRIKSQNRKLEKQNSLITDSINYAETLQSSILPISKKMDDVFESFVLYMPKDIVSGDFYWWSDLLLDDEFIVAVVDCTGHGVPGGFVSMLGNDMLNNIVKYNGIREPSKVVYELDKRIVKTLKQDVTNNMDGMDLILCQIKKRWEKREVVFVGANRPLIYYSAKDKSIGVFKGWDKTVGGILKIQRDYKFAQKRVVLEEGDTIYLFSDGYASQLDKNENRYGSKKLFKLLENIAPLSLKEQKNILETEIKSFIKDVEQYDDITIWGIKL
jgi:PAS domain S-box-containing protein